MMSSYTLRGLGSSFHHKNAVTPWSRQCLRSDAMHTISESVLSQAQGAHRLCAFAAEDDIVMQTFKKQQKAYRDLLKGMEVRLF